jgi:hypothetical protein
MVLTGLGVVVALGVAYAIIRIVVKRGPTGHRWTAQEAAFLAGEATLLGAVGMFAFVLLALGIPLVLLQDDFSLQQFLYAILGIAVSAAVAVGSVTRRFLYLATTTFVLVGVFLGFVA